jgi:signal peptidase I
MRKILGLVAILLVLGVVLAVTVGFRPYRIDSSAMEKTLDCARPGPGCVGSSDDRVLACRICLHFGAPSRGDIVVFDAPEEAALKCGEAGTFVKRVIGLPGETVREDRHGFIWTRSAGAKRFVKLRDWYVTSRQRAADSDHFDRTWHVPANAYFVVGDNRPESCDSRVWGSVPRHDLIGTVVLVYWPLSRIRFP